MNAPDGPDHVAPGHGQLAPDALSILVVNPDDEGRAAFAAALRALGARVLETSSGEMALYFCQQHVVHAVVAEIELPGLAASDVRAELRSRRGPPIVVRTPSQNAGAAAAWLDGGGGGWVSDTEAPAAVLARCRALARRARSSRP
jgi:DNA-binding response OmpR family regulator